MAYLYLYSQSNHHYYPHADLQISGRRSYLNSAMIIGHLHLIPSVLCGLTGKHRFSFRDGTGIGGEFSPSQRLTQTLSQTDTIIQR